MEEKNYNSSRNNAFQKTGPDSGITWLWIRKTNPKRHSGGSEGSSFFGLGFKAFRKWTFHKWARITGRKMGSWFFRKTNYMLKIACSSSFQIIMKCFRRNYRKWNSSQPINRLLPSKSTFLVQLHKCRVARICRWPFPLSIACSY